MAPAEQSDLGLFTGYMAFQGLPTAFPNFVIVLNCTMGRCECVSLSKVLEFIKDFN